MKLAFDQLFLLGLLSATLHWLGARSEIARPIWSRARGFVDKLLRCPACSGFWLGGLLVSFAGIRPLGVDAIPWRNVIAGALFGVFLTPVFEAVLLWGLKHSAVGGEDPPDGTFAADPELTESGEVTPNERPR